MILYIVIFMYSKWFKCYTFIRSKQSNTPSKEHFNHRRIPYEIVNIICKKQ